MYHIALAGPYQTCCWLSPPGYLATQTTTDWLPVPLRTGQCCYNPLPPHPAWLCQRKADCCLLDPDLYSHKTVFGYYQKKFFPATSHIFLHLKVETVNIYAFSESLKVCRDLAISEQFLAAGLGLVLVLGCECVCECVCVHVHTNEVWMGVVCECMCECMCVWVCVWVCVCAGACVWVCVSEYVSGVYVCVCRFSFWCWGLLLSSS